MKAASPITCGVAHHHSSTDKSSLGFAMPAPESVVVPSGTFLMGENSEDRFANGTERPRHRVTFARPFRMSVFPVTVGEFRRFHPSFAPNEPGDIPAVRVSWPDAVAYCSWLASKTGEPWRLPTEAEWEYACRAGSALPFHAGNSITVEHANFLYDEHGNKAGRGERSRQGEYPPNAFGLFDMHGNVCEWVEDLWHPDFDGSPPDGSAWTSAGRLGWRVIRGGAWDYMPRLLRSSWRDALPESTQRDNLGFRIAHSIPR